MSPNQKMLGLGIGAALLFFLVPLGWLVVIAAFVLLIIFRDPLWDFAQATAKAIFPQKPKPTPPPIEPPHPSDP